MISTGADSAYAPSENSTQTSKILVTVIEVEVLEVVVVVEIVVVLYQIVFIYMVYKTSQAAVNRLGISLTHILFLSFFFFIVFPVTVYYVKRDVGRMDGAETE